MTTFSAVFIIGLIYISLQRLEIEKCYWERVLSILSGKTALAYRIVDSIIMKVAAVIVMIFGSLLTELILG